MMSPTVSASPPPTSRASITWSNSPAGTHASEPLANTYFGLYLVNSTVSDANLKAYYDARPGLPLAFLDYLKAAVDGTNPFVYIKGSTVTLVDAAKHDLVSRRCRHDHPG